MTAPALPRIDEHTVAIDAPQSVVFDVIVGMFTQPEQARIIRGFTAMLGCEPAAGFAISESDPPARLVLLGKHRFSTYSIVFRIDPLGWDRCVCRAESLAVFPGIHGRVYRALVVGSRGHVVATKSLLELIRRRAERAVPAAK